MNETDTELDEDYFSESPYAEFFDLPHMENGAYVWPGHEAVPQPTLQEDQLFWAIVGVVFVAVILIIGGVRMIVG